MNPIAMFFGLILLAFSVFYVASPMRGSAPAKRLAGRGVPPLKMPSREKQRQAVLLAIRDLDFDYQAEKVAEEDYKTLRAILINEAAQLMQNQEREQEDSIEALIQSRRKAGLNGRAQPASKVQANGTSERVCQHCQAPLLPEARFCSKCGTPVETTACPKCKQALSPDDRFCPACGTAVSIEKQSTPPQQSQGRFYRKRDTGC